MQGTGPAGTVSFDWQKACLEGHSKAHKSPREEAVHRPLAAYTAKPSEFRSVNDTWQYFYLAEKQHFKGTELLFEGKLIH